MQFEENLQPRMAGWALRTAGIDDIAFYRREQEVKLKGGSLPFYVSCPYFSSDPPVPVAITALSLSPITHLQISVSDEAVGSSIRKHLTRYSLENDGEALLAQERKALDERLGAALKLHGISLVELQRGRTHFTRPAMEIVMHLCDETEGHLRMQLYELLTPLTVNRRDRPFAAHWLIRLLKEETIPYEQTSARLEELSCPQIAEELIQLIEDHRFEVFRRRSLCAALAKTKHHRAAQVIASILEDEGMARAGLEALGKLKAVQHIASVRRYLRSPDTSIGREARKTMKALGFPVETPPPPVHLVKNRRLLPKGLDEWSGNLDIEDLEPTLQALAEIIDSGFGQREISEVGAVVEGMKREQTKVFRFPIVVQGKETDLWLIFFMDDIDSPDLGIHSSPELIRKLNETLPEKE